MAKKLDITDSDSHEDALEEQLDSVVEQDELLDNDYEGDYDQVSKLSYVAKALKVSLLAYVIGASTYGVYGTYVTQATSVDVEALGSYATVSDINEVALDVSLLRDEVSGMNLAERLTQLELANDDASDRLSVVDSLERRVTTNESGIYRFESALRELKGYIDSLGFVTSEDLARVSKKVFEVQADYSDLEKEVKREGLSAVKSGMVAQAEGVEPSFDSEGEKVAQSSHYEVRYGLGPLNVEKIVRYTERYLIVMGDGVSGTVQLAQGNRVGRYRIDSVFEDHALVQDMISNEVFELRESK